MKSEKKNQSIFSTMNKSEQKVECVFFIEAIYDQFLAPASDNHPPTTGIANDVIEFCSQKELEKKSAKARIEEKQTTVDKLFASLVREVAGKLLHLALFNLVHPNSSTVRSRSFDLLARLAPISFGVNYENLKPDIIALRLKQLSVIKVQFLFLSCVQAFSNLSFHFRMPLVREQ